MIEVLQYIFGSPWRFLGVCVFLGIFALWKPVEINILHVRGDIDDEE